MITEQQDNAKDSLSNATSMTIDERCYFFPAVKKSEFLYGRLYLPSKERSTTGIVIAPPIGYEQIRRYRELISLARDLAREGYPVIYADYRGEGESFGEFKTSNLTMRAEDLSCAIQELEKQVEIDNVVCIGIRLGAVLAVLASKEQSISHLILCDPICNPKNYATDLLRANMILQKQYFGRISKSSQELRGYLKQGNSISIYGFHLGQALLEQLENIEITSSIEEFRGKTALLYSAPKKDTPPKKSLEKWHQSFDRNGDCDTICVAINLSWAEKKILSSRLDLLNEEIVRWLKKSK